MSEYEVITIVISLLALGIGLLNYKSISDIDERNEYKGKNVQINETISYALNLVERIQVDVNELNEFRFRLISSGSPYNNTKGADNGHNAVLVQIRICSEIKDKVEDLVKNLEELMDDEDKVAFDHSLNYKIQIQKYEINITESVGKSKIILNDMKNEIDFRSNHKWS